MATEKLKEVELSDFFTTTREKEGVWIEAKIGNKGTGLLFKIVGYASDENVKSADAYKKAHEIAEKETDVVKKAEMERRAVCERLTAIVIDLKCADGVNIKLNGEPLKYSKELVYQILWESMDIRTYIFTETFDSSNFMKKKL